MLTKIKRTLSKQPLARNVYRRLRRVGAVQQASFDNVFYCCTQKTASQWIKAVLDDPVVFKKTRLAIFPYEQYLTLLANAQGKRQWGADLAESMYRGHTPGAGLPPQTIAAHFYIDYETYRAIPKPGRYRTFYILRDPRDLVVSQYFSVRYSHKEMGKIRELRQRLSELDQGAGLRAIIDHLCAVGHFEAQRSWHKAASTDPNVRIFRYEHLAADNEAFIDSILRYLDVRLPASELKKLAERHDFSRLAKGRSFGQEDQTSHYRKGISGDWVNYFDAATAAHFGHVTSGLLAELGYT